MNISAILNEKEFKYSIIVTVNDREYREDLKWVVDNNIVNEDDIINLLQQCNKSNNRLIEAIKKHIK